MNAGSASIATTKAQARARPITILGAGIAGLACAAALAQRGHAVQIVEQAQALTEVGAGLQIAPNGMRVLEALRVDVPALRSDAVHLIDGKTERRVIRMPLKGGFRLIHRADLITALSRVALEAGVSLRLGTRVLEVSDGRLITDLGEMRVGRIVGADGVRGASRRYVIPEHRPTWTGQVAWRTTVPVAEGWPQETQIHLGPRRHMVLYPLRDGRMLNIVAVEERDTWVSDSWSHRDDPAHLRAAFEGFSPSIRMLLNRVETVHLWGLSDHGASADWNRGDVTLIGDAAHPTLPFLAQGANLALEDAWTLAARWDDPQGWAAMRRPRAERTLAAAQANAANYHLRGAKKAAAHTALRLLNRVAPALPLRGFDWLYDHDVTEAAP